jgi:hypothetical protein
MYKKATCLLLIWMVVSLNSCTKWYDCYAGDYHCDCRQMYVIFEPNKARDSSYAKYDSIIAITYDKENKKVGLASFPLIAFHSTDSFSYETYPHIDDSLASFKYLFFGEKRMTYINLRYLRYSEYRDTCVCDKK